MAFPLSLSSLLWVVVLCYLLDCLVVSADIPERAPAWPGRHLRAPSRPTPAPAAGAGGSEPCKCPPTGRTPGFWLPASVVTRCCYCRRPAAVAAAAAATTATNTTAAPSNNALLPLATAAALAATVAAASSPSSRTCPRALPAVPDHWDDAGLYVESLVWGW